MWKNPGFRPGCGLHGPQEAAFRGAKAKKWCFSNELAPVFE
jgi:hypothetical protein